MIQRFLFSVIIAALLATPAVGVLTIGGTTVAKDDNTYAQMGSEVVFADPMIASTETFAFQNLAHFFKHCAIRQAIMDAIMGMKAQGDIDFDYGAEYPNLGGNLDIFKDLYPDPAHPGVISMWFKVKPGVKTSAAVAQIEIGTTRSDCRAAAVCAVLVGHDKVLFGAFLDAQVPAGTFNSYTFYLAGDAADTGTVVPGDVRFMKNDPRYEKGSRDNGMTSQQAIWNGEWTICVGDDSYKGLGLPAMSEADLRAELRFNLGNDAKIQLTNDEAETNIKWTVLKRIAIFPP